MAKKSADKKAADKSKLTLYPGSKTNKIKNPPKPTPAEKPKE